MDRTAIQERYGIIGNSVAIRNVIDRVRLVANADITVLIEGESGVGKELIAQALHGLSHRKHKTLVVVNCGAIPEGLIESELFGHEKGSYTGATDLRKGHFEEADGGTIFLDEIGEMPLQAQVRLLRVLESGTFSRVGSSKLIKVNTRVIAATNKDLGKEVSAGRFREDLYYRLSTVRMEIPPLRVRKEDILPLFEHFLYQYSRQYNAPMKRPDESVRMLLERYSFPGNIRELRNLAEQASVLVRGNALTASDLQPFLRGISASGLKHIPSEDDFNVSNEMLYRALVAMNIEMRELKSVVHSLVTKQGVAQYSNIAPKPTEYPSEYVMYDEAGSHSPLLLPPALPQVLPQKTTFHTPESTFQVHSSSKDYHNEIEDVVSYQVETDRLDEKSAPETENAFDLSEKVLPTLQDMEKMLIVEALKRFRGNRRKTATTLGISERTLYRKINEFDLQDLADEDL